MMIDPDKWSKRSIIIIGLICCVKANDISKEIVIIYRPIIRPEDISDHIVLVKLHWIKEWWIIFFSIKRIDKKKSFFLKVFQNCSSISFYNCCHPLALYLIAIVFLQKTQIFSPCPNFHARHFYSCFCWSSWYLDIITMLFLRDSDYLISLQQMLHRCPH